MNHFNTNKQRRCYLLKKRINTASEMTGNSQVGCVLGSKRRSCFKEEKSDQLCHILLTNQVRWILRTESTGLTMWRSLITFTIAVSGEK